MTTDKSNDLLLVKIGSVLQDQSNQANVHKSLHRSLWIASSLISLAIAMLSSSDITVFGSSSVVIAKYLAIILPMVTGYIVLRSPEKLWIAEINTRNKLADLKAEIELILDRGGDLDRPAYEKRFLEILANANNRWVEIKSQ